MRDRLRKTMLLGCQDGLFQATKTAAVLKKEAHILHLREQLEATLTAEQIGQLLQFHLALTEAKELEVTEAFFYGYRLATNTLIENLQV